MIFTSKSKFFLFLWMDATRMGLGRNMAKRAPVNIPKIPADFKSFLKKQNQLDLDT